MRLAFVGILLEHDRDRRERAATCRSGSRASRPPGSRWPTSLAVPRRPRRRASTSDFLRHAGPLADILPDPGPVHPERRLDRRRVPDRRSRVLPVRDGRPTARRGRRTRRRRGRRPAGRPGRHDPHAARASRARWAASASGRARAWRRASTEAAALDRPLVLGTPGTGLAGPSSEHIAVDRRRRRDCRPAADRPHGRARARAGRGRGLVDDGVARPALPRIEVGERVRRHPYVRLALNGSFSALWTGQLISLFGDRVHQIALTFLVGGRHGFAARGRVRLRRGDDPEPAPVADRGHLRRPLEPARRDDRERPAARRVRAPDPDRRRHEHLPRLPADLPDHVDLDLLPAGPGRDPAADRPPTTSC